MGPRSWIRPLGKRFLPWLAVGACLALLVVNLLHDSLFHGRVLEASLSPSPSRQETSLSLGEAAAPTVTLSEVKRKAAGLRVERARLVAMPSEVGVSGRIEATPDRRIDVRPGVAGVVRAVHVALGQKVSKGEPLATLDSADVATARLDVRARQRDLINARTEGDWRKTIAANVAELISSLRKRTSAATLETRFADRPLGTNRAVLLQAYSEYEIAAHEEAKQKDLLRQKIVGEHPAFLALHAREGAQAKYESVLEQVRHDAAQQTRLGDAQVRLAAAAVIDAAQRLRVLGVAEDVAGLVARPEVSSRPLDETDGLTAYTIVAPFDGTVIARDPSAVTSQRVAAGDTLLTLADLSTVLVAAQVPESDLAVLPDMNGGTVRLTAAAYPGRSFEATLVSIGVQVDPSTRTVPLLAQVADPDGLLKLGLFVRIILDSPTTEDALTVPEAAVVEVEGRPAVFLPAGPDDSSFALRPVKLGRRAGGRQVVTAGLTPDDRVVSAGAFLLKSELAFLIEGDEE